MGHLETGLFDTAIILRFVRHLVNGTKINQGRLQEFGLWYISYHNISYVHMIAKSGVED